MNRLWVVLLCLSGLALAACDPLEPTEPQVPEQLHEELHKEQGEGGEAQSSRAEPKALQTPQAKPGAPISVSYRVSEAAGNGAGRDVELVITSSQGEARIFASPQIEDDSALSFVQAPGLRVPVSMRRLNGDSAGEYRFRVRPERAGRHVVNVLLEVETENGVMSRSVAIPVDAAGYPNGTQQNGSHQKQLAAVPEPGVDAAGEAIISLPADESR